jgi:8-oxo-dGTP pyrophosphatase MutT (NUDIX family)
VLVPLCNVGGEPSILFTLRSAHVSTHKNEISFPGGHSEEEDASFIDTALRETREELLGTYDFDSIDVLGVTGTVPSLTGSPVTPVIAVFTEDFDNEEHLQDIFQPPYSNSTDDNNSDNHDTREVEVVFRRSLAHLMQHETSQPLERLGTVGPVFPGPEGKIWGLTAVILRPLLHAVIIPAFREDA